MILRLRRQHRATWMMLAVLLPLLLVLALAWRPAPAAAELPASLERLR